MSKVRLDLLAVNAKGGSNPHPVRFAAWQRRQKRVGIPLVSGLSEADWRITPYLKALCREPGVEFWQGKGTHGAREVAIQKFGLRFHPTYFESVQLTKNVNPPGPKHNAQGAGMDRWATLVRGNVGGVKVTVISTHAPTNTRSQGDWSNTAGAAQWRDHGRPKLTALVKREEALGRQVFIIGDLNEILTRSKTGTGEWAKSLNMTPVVVDVMWIIVGSGPLKIRRHKVLRRAPGCDHPHELLVQLST